MCPHISLQLSLPPFALSSPTSALIFPLVLIPAPSDPLFVQKHDFSLDFEICLCLFPSRFHSFRILFIQANCRLHEICSEVDGCGQKRVKADRVSCLDDVERVMCSLKCDHISLFCNLFDFRPHRELRIEQAFRLDVISANFHVSLFRKSRFHPTAYN